MINPLAFPPTKRSDEYFAFNERSFTRAGTPMSWEAVFRRYQTMVRAACEALGLHRWRIEFAVVDADSQVAYVNYNVGALAATFALSEALPISMLPVHDEDNYAVDEVALHEVIHLFLAEYEQHLLEDDLSHDAKEALADSLQHGLVNTLVPIIMKYISKPEDTHTCACCSEE